MTVLLAMRESLARLGALPTRAAIIQAAPREVCACCGFQRALLSRIQGSLWIPEVLHDPDPPANFEEFVRTAEIPLEHMLLETEMVRRRRPALVVDARTDERTYKGIIDASAAHSYTASPILVGRRSIAFMHCDRLGSDEPLTEADRDHLWMFAQELALILERAALTERLADFEREARDTLDNAFTDLTAVRTAIPTIGEEPPDPTSDDDADTAPTSRLLLALTAREREVLDLLVTGATNATLANELVIGEATVKSHVLSILRKLRVDNRAQAVARYLAGRS